MQGCCGSSGQECLSESKARMAMLSKDGVVIAIDGLSIEPCGIAVLVAACH